MTQNCVASVANKKNLLNNTAVVHEGCNQKTQQCLICDAMFSAIHERKKNIQLIIL